MTGWFAPFIFYFARCNVNKLRRQVELLKSENEILRKRVPKKRIFLAKENRDLLLKLGTAIGSDASKLVTVVHRRIYQRWIREKNLGKPAKKMGRRWCTTVGQEIHGAMALPSSSSTPYDATGFGWNTFDISQDAGRRRRTRSGVIIGPKAARTRSILGPGSVRPPLAAAGVERRLARTSTERERGQGRH